MLSDEGSTATDNFFSCDYDFENSSADEQKKTPEHYAWAFKIALAISAFFLLWSFLEFKKSNEFTRYAVETNGTVADLWTARNWFTQCNQPCSRHRRNYFVKVEFGGADGQQHSYRKRISKQHWHTLAKGMQVPVWFVPSNPSNFALSGQNAINGHYGQLFAGLVSLVIAGWFAFEYYATRARPRSLAWQKPNSSSSTSERNATLMAGRKSAIKRV